VAEVTTAAHTGRFRCFFFSFSPQRQANTYGSKARSTWNSVYPLEKPISANQTAAILTRSNSSSQNSPPRVTAATHTFETSGVDAGPFCGSRPKAHISDKIEPDLGIVLVWGQRYREMQSYSNPVSHSLTHLIRQRNSPALLTRKNRWNARKIFHSSTVVTHLQFLFCLFFVDHCSGTVTVFIRGSLTTGSNTVS
jgi:hypothetical protein